MIRLVFLLLGAPALKPVWRLLTVAGIFWMLVGLAILFDLSDGALSVVLDTLAIFLVIEGLVEIAAAMSVGLREHWITYGCIARLASIRRSRNSFLVRSMKARSFGCAWERCGK